MAIFFFFFWKKNFFVLTLKGQSFFASKVESKFWQLPWFSDVFTLGKHFAPKCMRVRGTMVQKERLNDVSFTSNISFSKAHSFSKPCFAWSSLYGNEVPYLMSAEKGFVKLPCSHKMKIHNHCFNYEQTLELHLPCVQHIHWGLKCLGGVIFGWKQG